MWPKGSQKECVGENRLIQKRSDQAEVTQIGVKDRTAPKAKG